MIRLIASDIDGTLLQNGATSLPEELFPLIRKLRERGIAFCAASGRQYSSLRRLFAPVADEIYYICENGAAVYDMGSEGRLLGKTIMDRELAEKLAGEIVARPDCEVLICGANTSYLSPKNEEIVITLRDFVGNHVVVVPDAAHVPEDIIKVSACCDPDTQRVEQEMAPRWKEHFQVAVAGKEWLDFTLADKGTGIRTVCSALHIAPEDVMAFGDNFNDIPMLKQVGHPILMSGAHPRLREQFSIQADNVPEILETLLTNQNS